jgi:hypothetical protein
MKRRSVFAALAALFGGQTQGQEHVEEWRYITRMDPHGNTFIGKATPTPNQCPVCGTMAEPYVRPTESEYFDTDTCIADQGNPSFAVCRQPSKMRRVGPDERVTRCKRCNAAFWQDASGEQAK